MRKSMRFFVATLSLLVLIAGLAAVNAGTLPQAGDDITAGAQLYDKWYARLGVEPPAGNHPIWERQTTNTRSGPETWRCAECHGWDYQGAAGAYGIGSSHYTGFPSVFVLADRLSEEEIIAHLNGELDPLHDFSNLMDETSLRQLTAFLKNGLIDDREFIDPVSLQAIGGNTSNGKNLYETVCAACHGVDGQTLALKSDGMDQSLGDVASRDPYRFLHRSRFGVAGVVMPIGRDLGWSTEDSRDVLAYVQTLPMRTGQPVPAGAGEGSEPAPQVGGPGTSVLDGILAGLGVFFGMFGLSILFGLGFIAFLGAVVFLLRKRK
jgi:mono/diheme cytochrome c family protein/nitrate reductase cytochrome c-type subunit